MKFKIVCDSCGSIYGEHEGHYRCPSCGGILSVQYLKQNESQRKDEQPKRGMWKYGDCLPLVSNNPVSMGEGDTPLVPLVNWNKTSSRIYVKMETANPTGTYKDRPASVSVSRARELGAKGVIVASDGNAAPAVAAYAARAGLPCVVFMPGDTPRERLQQTAAYGANILLLDGDINDCLDRAKDAGVFLNFHNCSTTVSLNPYQVEGDKTIAYEIVDQLGFCPDWITVPIGGGSLLSGIVKGLKEMREAGKIARLPKLLAVQAEACAPFVRAFESNTPIVRERNPLPTCALTITVPYPPDGLQAMEALHAVDGAVAAVSEEELLRTVELLASTQGLLAEPSGAASLAGRDKKEREGLFEEGSTIVSVITGTGLKTLDIYGERLDMTRLVSLPNTADAVLSHVEKVFVGKW